MDTKLTNRQKAKGISVEGETPAWTAVHSGVPQCSVLGPLPFLIYIDDLEDGVASNILIFADDTNIFRRVQTRQECHTLQEDLNRLVQGSEKWQMLFNQCRNVFTSGERIEKNLAKWIIRFC